ncbi:helix-turn-helix domain-containing protein [Oerskovia paurometabola]|uniref:Helix-turn-helix domain-containing protein n=1 Tax=Oerskovia paurometabola TaxID=162170 RepID=A0ABW1XDP4_9CELL|nr:helix-turn-helix domain-containing protein [Oerskovia paurometabola]MBM7498871.1 transposase InsO family protein [Oerskovia paurometabola]
MAQLALRGRSVAVTISELARCVIDEGHHSVDAGPDTSLDGSAALASLEAADRRKVEELAGVVQQLLDDASPLAPRVARAAKKLGMSPRSLERRIAAYRRTGVAGLVDSRATRTRSSLVDPRWDEACVRVLRSYTYASTPTRSAVLAQIARDLEDQYGPDVVAIPATTTAYRRLNSLAKGKQSFGSATGRRSVAERPQGVLGRLRADRPGQYVVLDTNDLDVFAMEPVTLRWVKVQLTAAMDLYSRCIVGLKVTPVSTKAVDVASVLYQCVRPSNESEQGPGFPYHGVPDAVLVGTEVPDERLLSRQRGLPAVFAMTIVVDRGKQYISSHVISPAVLSQSAWPGFVVRTNLTHVPGARCQFPPPAWRALSCRSENAFALVAENGSPERSALRANFPQMAARPQLPQIRSPHGRIAGNGAARP